MLSPGTSGFATAVASGVPTPAPLALTVPAQPGGSGPQHLINGPPALNEADPLLGTTIGSFKVTRRLGVGGMGTVYLGEQAAIGSKVAIKVLHEHLCSNPSLVQRFYAEARAANVIGHEHIVSIIDLNVIPPSRYYFVMEYLEGKALNELPRPMGHPLMVHILEQACDALQAAHQNGVVHRDLKPENIILTRRGRNDQFVKLLDFGIAKLFATELAGQQTVAGMIMGTPEFMAPEQTSGQPVDGRTDLYALGVIAYELATGGLPFTSVNLADLFIAHRMKEAKAPHLVNPAVPEALSRAIMKALAKAPEDRFQTADEFRDALVASMDGVAPYRSAGGASPAQAGVPGPASRPAAPMPPAATPGPGSPDPGPPPQAAAARRPPPAVPWDTPDAALGISPAWSASAVAPKEPAVEAPLAPAPLASPPPPLASPPSPPTSTAASAAPAAVEASPAPPPPPAAPSVPAPPGAPGWKSPVATPGARPASGGAAPASPGASGSSGVHAASVPPGASSPGAASGSGTHAAYVPGSGLHATSTPGSAVHGATPGGGHRQPSGSSLHATSTPAGGFRPSGSGLHGAGRPSSGGTPVPLQATTRPSGSYTPTGSRIPNPGTPPPGYGASPSRSTPSQQQRVDSSLSGGALGHEVRLYDGAKGSFRTLRCTDLTRSGMFVHAETGLPAVFSKVKLGLVLGVGKELALTGEVVRHVTLEQSRAWGMPVGFGVQLLQLGSAQKEALATLTRGGTPSSVQAVDLPGDPRADVPLARFRKYVNGTHYDLLDLFEDADFPEVRLRIRETKKMLEELRTRPLSSRQRDDLEAYDQRLDEAFSTVGNARNRLDYDGGRGNWKGAARCIAGGVSVTELDNARRRYLATREKVAGVAHLHFTTGSAWENQKEFLPAQQEYERALALDPLNLTFHQRYQALRRHMTAPLPPPRRK